MTTPCIVSPSDDRDEIGLTLLMLAAHGEVDGRTWRGFEVMVRDHVVDREWAAVSFIGRILDELAEGNQ